MYGSANDGTVVSVHDGDGKMIGRVCHGPGNVTRAYREVEVPLPADYSTLEDAVTAVQADHAAAKAPPKAKKQPTKKGGANK